MAKRSNLSFAFNLSLIVVGMLALTAAAVPLYRLFCEATGYDGTTQKGTGAILRVTDRDITVGFNADIAPALPWEFKPAEHEIKTKIGQKVLTHFIARNTANHPITGRAVYNVTPFSVGNYFVKIECFCFKEQTLAAGQTVDMPVLFYVDSAMVDDPQMNGIKTITLSYTFFPVKTEASSSKRN